MEITLVTSSDDIIHATSNDKKTGCGINLMKPDNTSRYHRREKMNDLSEITCEKCKSKIAKEIIRADSKAMKALLKQERIRAKKGLDEEDMVTLSELQARQNEQYNEPEPEPEISEPAPENTAYNTQTEPEKLPVIDDVSIPAIDSPVSADEEKQEIRKPVPEPVKPAAAPVINDISSAVEKLNTPPVQQFTPPPVHSMAAVGNTGQIISVPMLTGYDQSGQPIYTYVQMQLQGYDQNGQPIFIPILNQGMSMNIPAPPPPAAATENTAQEVPDSANVTKIAVNPHSRDASQTFINAASESNDDFHQFTTEMEKAMKITLVTDFFNGTVHGMYNHKETGCNIELIDSDIVSRYKCTGQITDINEITCEKCKAKIINELSKTIQKK